MYMVNLKIAVCISDTSTRSFKCMQHINSTNSNYELYTFVHQCIVRSQTRRMRERAMTTIERTHTVYVFDKLVIQVLSQ